jgi:hypothetical protein
LLSQKRGFAHKLFDSPQVLIASFHCIAPCSKRRKDNYPTELIRFRASGKVVVATWVALRVS